MTARDATLDDLDVVASWVRTADDCRLWAGPAVSFPLSLGRLAVEIQFAAAENLALEEGAQVVAFGQVVPRSGGRAHLARVIVRPDARGRGLGNVLVGELVGRARRSGARLATLNVYEANLVARRAYEAAGFHRSSWPDDEGPPPVGIVPMSLRLREAR